MSFNKRRLFLQRCAAIGLSVVAGRVGAQAAPKKKNARVNPFHAPLYWTAYEYNHLTDGYIPEPTWAANIDWVEKNLKPYGYKMICIDGWGDDNQYDKYGYRMSHSSQWTHDYAWWAKDLQSRGMALGMYYNPLWVNKRAADAGVKIKGTDIPLSTLLNLDENAKYFTWAQVERPGAEQFVKGYIQFYADMGIKYLRVDFLSWFETGQDRFMGTVGPNRPHADYVTALRWMREACDANQVFLSLVMPSLSNEAEAEKTYGDMFRVNDDAGDGTWGRFSDITRGIRRSVWSQYSSAFDGLIYWSYLAGRHKVILDPDFIRLNTFANDDERKSAISVCLMAGGPVTVADQHSTIGNSLWLYQNREMLALNADGFVGKPLTHDPTDERSQTWTGQMSNGEWVVGLFNREKDARTRQIDFASLSLTKSAFVRDLWEHKDLGMMSSFQATLPPHSCVVIRVSSKKTRG